MPGAGADTRERLLRAGARLFATRGVHNVRLYEINEAAGQRNESALHYHFGSREGFLQALIDDYRARFEPRRRAMVDEMAADGRVGLRDWVQAMVVPIGEDLASDDGRHCVRAVSQLVVDRGVRPRHTDSPDSWDDTMAAIRRHLTHLPEAVRSQRTAVASLLCTTAIADRARHIDAGGASLVDDEAFVADLAEMIVAALEAPAAPNFTR